MKQFSVILMTVILLLTLTFGLCFSSSAHSLSYVEPSYSWADAEDDFGTHPVDDEGRLKEGAAVFNGVWTVEWMDTETGEFHPMEAYFSKSQQGWLHSGWANLYTATVDSVWTRGPQTYCTVSAKTKIHPGNGAGATITYIVPVSGVISYEAAVAAYDAGNKSSSANGGNALWLYVNDTRVWPSGDEEAYFYNDTGTKELSFASFRVKEGDRVRMVVAVKPGTNNGGKGCNIKTLPVVTYHSTDDGTPVGNPKGVTPSGILTQDLTLDGCKVLWDETPGAVGYNVYVDGKKMNDSPVKENSYVVTGLEPAGFYEVSVTSVTASGSESDPSEPQTFRTKNPPASRTDSDTRTETPVTDTDEAIDSGSVTPVSSGTDSSGSVTVPEGNNALLWTVISVAAVLILGLSVALVLVVRRKK